jgi:heat shock protein HslJ/N-acetylneuraminic acid mutarotase
MRPALPSLLFALVAAAACGGGDGNEDDQRTPPPAETAASTPAPSDAQRLLGTRWVLVDVAGVPALDAPAATLEFSSLEEIHGNGSCNQFTGLVLVSGSGMVVDSLRSTLMACADAGVTAQEARYFQALRGAGLFTFEGHELLIHNDQFDQPLRFRPDEAAATAEGEWQELPPLPGGVRQETAVVALGDEIVVIGGFGADNSAQTRVEAYRPATREWRDLPDLPVAMHHANAGVVGDSIWVVGFLTGNDFRPDGRVFVLRPGADQWGAGPSMPQGTQRGASAVGVIDGRIYVAGGLRGGAVTDFSVFDPAAGTWEELPDLPLRRDHFVGGAVGTKFVVAGGREGQITSITGRVDIFDTASGEWSRGADMPTPRGGTAGAVIDGTLYVFGGEGNTADAFGVFPQAEAYDVANDRWEQLPPMPTPRHGTGAAALGGVIYIPGGADIQAYGAVDTVESFTPR